MRPLKDAVRQTLRWAGWLALCAVAGCGGGETGGESGGIGPSDAGLAAVQMDGQTERRASLLALIAASEEPHGPIRVKRPALPDVLKAADVDARREEGGPVQLTLKGPEGTQALSLELASVRGVGYPSVRARVSSVRTNGDAPVASLRAQCASASECTFRVPLRDGTQRLHVLRIPEDAAARLLPSEAEGEVLVVARQVAMPRRTVVTLTLESGGHASSARVAYLGPDAIQAAVGAPAPADGTISASSLATPAAWAIEAPSRRYPFVPRS